MSDRPEPPVSSAATVSELRVTAVAALVNIVTEDFYAVTDEDVGSLAQGVLDLLADVERLTTRGGIALSMIPAAKVEKFHRRCEELGV